MKRTLILGVLVAGILIGLLSAPGASAQPAEWTVVATERGAGVFELVVRDNKVVSTTPLLGRAYILAAASDRLLVSETGATGSNSEPTVFHYGKTSPAATFETFTGQRTLVAPLGSNVVVLQTNPNGDKADVFRKNLAFGDERSLGSIDLNPDPAASYAWIENGVSAPVGGNSVYFGAQVYRPKQGTADEGNRGIAFNIYHVGATGGPSLFMTFSTAPYDGYVTGFCVSPSGRRIAITNFINGGSLFQERLTVIDRLNHRTWSTQTPDSLGSSCFLDDSTLVVASGKSLILHELQSSGIKRTKINGFQGADRLLNANYINR